MQPLVVRQIDDQRTKLLPANVVGALLSRQDWIRFQSLSAMLLMKQPSRWRLIENIQREDLNAMEESLALQRLQQEFQLTQQQVADAVGKSRSAVTNLMRLTSLQLEVQKLLERGDLELGHAKCLLALEGSVQVNAARTVVGSSMTVRQTEALIKKLQSGSRPKP